MICGCTSALGKPSRWTWSKCDGPWAWWSPSRTLTPISCSCCKRDTGSCGGRSSGERKSRAEKKGWSLDHPFRAFVGISEEQLQAELDAAWDIALAAGVPEVGVCSIRLP